MKYESLKQREHREGYNKAMGYKERNMADDTCEDCYESPCMCKELENQRKLRELRGGM